MEIASAAGILGRDAIGLEAVNSALTLDVVQTILSPLELRLQAARERGELLIEFPKTTPDGQPFTMRWMHETLRERFDRAKLGRIVFNPNAHPDEFFFDEQTSRTGPLFISKAPIPGSTGKNACQMTDCLNDYLYNQVFQGRDLPAVYQAAAQEWRDAKKALENLLCSNWQEASRKLAALQLYQRYVPRPVEVLAALTSSLLINGERRMQGIYTVTNAVTSDGYLVLVGNLDPHGTAVSGWYPYFDDRHIGVCLAAEPKNLGF